jgi:hypothetical protein
VKNAASCLHDGSVRPRLFHSRRIFDF